MSGPHPPGAGRRGVGVLSLVEVGLGTLAGATTTLLYTSYFTGLSYLSPLLIAAAAGAVLAGVAALRRWRTGATLLTAVLGFLVLAVFGVFTSTLDSGLPTSDTATGLGSGLVRGWALMLSVSLPTDVTGELLVTPALLTWSAVFLGITLGLRTRSVLVPLLPPLVALVAGLLFTAGRTDSGLPVAAVFLVAALALMLVRSIRLDSDDTFGSPDPARDSDSAGRLRLTAGRAALGTPIVLLAALLGTAGAGLIPVSTGTHRFDPRDVVPLQLELTDTLTPLATLKSQLRDPQRQLFTVQVDDEGSGAGIDRVRTAVLDGFDGALWTSDDSFLLAGRALAPDPTLVDARQVTVHVSITQLNGPYLPAPGWPVHVDRSGFGFSDTSGALVTNDALSGLSYEVVGELRPRDDSALRDTVPNLAEGSDRYTRLPTGLPPDIRAKGAELTSRTNNPYEKLVAIETYLQKLPYSLDARPGHSYDALRRLFSSDPRDQVGYAEQHASAFAVLARSQGFPTRVAVGYLLRSDQRSDSTYTVTSGDAHAWAEVNLAGYGWVVFNPTDPTRTSTTPDQKRTEAGPDNAPADSNNRGSQPVVDPDLLAKGTETNLLKWPLLPLTVLVLLLVLVPVVITGEKIRRRRQRRRGSGAARIVGAWRETTDRLVEHGLGVPQSWTAQEVARRAERQLGEPASAVAVLAPIVTKAIFCPTPPDDDTIRRAWELDARLGRDLRRAGGPFSRVRAWLDPRPLIAGRQDRRRRRRTWEKLQGG